MKFKLFLISVFPALVYGSSVPGKNYGLPRNGLETNGVAVGWYPSNGNATEGVISPRYTLKQINQRLKAKSATYGLYSHLNSDNYDDYELMDVFGDVVRSGAVFIPAIMPVLSAGFSGVTPEVAAQIARSMRKFTDRGVVVWLRFAHEMNWYVDPTAEPRYFGTSAEFVAAWEIVAKAVSDNPRVLMFWSPNNLGGHPASVLDEWYPNNDSVDLVGIDCYPQNSNQSFEYCYKDFYDRFSTGKQKPFAIGETGADATFKEDWLKQLVSQSNKEYPKYISTTWFEYDKEEDFRIVMVDEKVLQQTKKNLYLT